MAQEATVASVTTEQEEEVGVLVKEFSGQKVVWGPTHRVISTTDAQHRYGRLVHIPEGVIVVPVGVPADGEVLGVAEEGLLKLSQGAAPEQFADVHRVLQGCGVPGSEMLNGEGRKDREESEKKPTAVVTKWQPTGQVLATEACFGHMFLKILFHGHHLKCSSLSPPEKWQHGLAFLRGTIKVLPPSFLCDSFYQACHSQHYLPSPGAAVDLAAAELQRQLSSGPHLLTLCGELAMNCTS